jgi:stress-induced morphogen
MHLQVAQFGTSSEDTGNTVVGRCEANIANALKPTHLRVRGMHDDPNGSHIIVEVVSEAFEGKNPVMRQRMVYKALWEEMSAGGSLHAVDGITAMTPAEYAKKLV